MMPVIKVWCLPWMVEGKLNELHRKIVEAVVSVEELGLKSEHEMMCLFPADMMKKGLGEEIIIEVIGLIESSKLTSMVRQQLADALTDVIHKTLPEAFVECFIFSPRTVCTYCTRNSVPI